MRKASAFSYGRRRMTSGRDERIGKGAHQAPLLVVAQSAPNGFAGWSAPATCSAGCDPESGHPVAQGLHSVGREDTIDRDGLVRLVGSLSRYLVEQPPDPAGGENGRHAVEGGRPSRRPRRLASSSSSTPIGRPWVTRR
jgi:hypothetical protein